MEICNLCIKDAQEANTKQHKTKQKQKTKNSAYYEIPTEREKKNTVELRICHLVIYLSIYFFVKVWISLPFTKL